MKRLLKSMSDEKKRHIHLPTHVFNNSDNESGDRDVCCLCDLKITWHACRKKRSHWQTFGKCGGGGEGNDHQLAKWRLWYHHNAGVILKFKRNCRRHGESILEAPVGTRAITEKCVGVKVQGKFDVALMNASMQIVFGIEVFHSHTTTNTQAREGIQWPEVAASEVNEKLNDLLDVGTVITLADIQTCAQCQADPLPEDVIPGRWEEEEEQPVRPFAFKGKDKITSIKHVRSDMNLLAQMIKQKLTL